MSAQDRFHAGWSKNHPCLVSSWFSLGYDLKTNIISNFLYIQKRTEIISIQLPKADLVVKGDFDGFIEMMGNVSALLLLITTSSVQARNL